MTNLELVECSVGIGNEKNEIVRAVSTSYSTLEEYCKEKYGMPIGSPINWTDRHFIIRNSNIIIVQGI